MKTSKLNSGNYRVQVIAGYNENGKRIVKSFTAKTEWEAIKMAEDFKRLHVDITPTKITVREAVNAYIDSKRSLIAASTLYGYEVAAKNRLQSIQGYYIADLKIIDIQRAINIDAERGLGYKSIKSAYDLIRSAASIFEVDLPSVRKLIPDYIYNLIQKVPHKTENDFIINENYGNIKARYDRLLKKHGMKMTFHDLRAQFATTMNGLDVQKEVLEKLGGWANSKVLDAVYIRTPKQRVRDSLKIFDDFMYGVI